MHKLPKYIFLISIIRGQDNAELVDVLKDYFSGVPYIDYTDYANKQAIHYIVYESRIIKKVAYAIYNMKLKILDYSNYKLNHNSTIYYRRYSYDASIMPDRIAVDYINTQLQLWNTV